MIDVSRLDDFVDSKSLLTGSHMKHSTSNKRRRNEAMDELVSPSRKTFRYFTVDNVTSDDGSKQSSGYLTGCLLISGDLLFINRINDDYEIRLHPEFIEDIDIPKSKAKVVTKSFDQAKSIVSNFKITDNMKLENVTCVYRYANLNRLIIIAIPSTKKGFATLVIINAGLSSAVQTRKQEVQLVSEKEEVALVTCIDSSHILLGSTQGNLYLIQLEKSPPHRIIAADHLMPNSNISWFMSLAKTGAKLLGLQSSFMREKIADPSVIASSWIESYATLIVITSSMLQAWFHPTIPGKERLLMEWNLSERLMVDFESMNMYPSSLQLVDVLVLPEDVMSDVIHVVALALAFTHNISGGTTISLWLHALTIHYTSYTEMDAEVQIIRSSSILVDGDITLCAHLSPRIHSIPTSDVTATATVPSNRFYISWCNRALHSLHVMLGDGLNIVLAADSVDNGHAAAGVTIPAFLTEDTGIDADSILTAAVVQGFDAICIVKQDGMVYFTLSEIQGHPSLRSDDVHHKHKKSLRPAALLYAIAIGELDHLHVSERLVKTMMEGNAIDDVLIQQICHQVVSYSDSIHDGYPTSPTSRATQVPRPSAFISDDLYEKSRRIRRIIVALEDWGWESYSFAPRRILQSIEFHRTLHLSLQELQQRVQNITADDPDAYLSHRRHRLLDLAYMGGVDTWAATIKRIVSQDVHLSVDMFKEQGLAIADVFFLQHCMAAPPAVQMLVQVLSELPREHTRAAYIFGATILVVNQLNEMKTQATPGFINADSSILCDDKMRASLVSLIDLLTNALASAYPDDPIVELTHRHDDSVHHPHRKHNLLLCDLCSYALQSYVIEAESVGLLSEDEQVVLWRHTAQHMSQPWRDHYQHCKSKARNLIIACHNLPAAFQLTVTYLDYEGLFICYESEPSRYQSQIYDMLDRYADVYGSQDVVLGLFWLESLEIRQYPSSAIFEFGLHCPSQLTNFLSSRPHLAWLYDLDHRQYGRAAEHAIQHAQGIDRLSHARTIFSIAKLAARLATCTSTTASEEEKKPETNTNAGFCLGEADRHLALMKAQEAIQQLSTRFQARSHRSLSRLSPLQLIDQLISCMQYILQRKDKILSAADIDILARAIAIGLSVLTMVDGYEAKDIIDGYVVRIWAMSLLLQQELWMHRSSGSSEELVIESNELGLTDDEEQELLGSLYAQALTICLDEGKAFERGELLPTALNRCFIPMVDADHNKVQLLKDVLDASGLKNTNTENIVDDDHHQIGYSIRLIRSVTGATARRMVGDVQQM